MVQFHAAKSMLAPLERFRQEGFDTEQMLRGTGLSHEVLSREGQRVSLAQERLFLGNLLQLTGDPGVGLRIGASYELHYFGIWAYALMSAPNLRQAAALAYRYLDLAFTFMQHSMLTEGDSVVMAMQAEGVESALFPVICDRELAATHKILSGLVEYRFPLQRVALMHQPKARQSAYEAFFQCPVEFGAETNQLCFDGGLLDQSLPKRDAGMAALCIRQCEHLKAGGHLRGPMAEEVRQLILARPRYFPAVDAVAETLGLSVRTLRRRLQAENTRFRDILAETRYGLAREYLLTTPLSVEQIAAFLGYGEPGNFTQAFKRWSGLSPLQYRRQNHTHRHPDGWFGQAQSRLT